MNPQSQLLSAIDALDETAISAALDAGADVNLPDDEGKVPLVRAIDGALGLRESVYDPYPTGKPDETETRGKILNVVTLLLDKGANADHRVDGAGDPLVWATFANEAPLVRLLLERGATPNFLVDEEWFYDSAEMDFFHHLTELDEPEDATDADLESPESFIAYLERKNNARGGGFAPDVLKILRKAGATSASEREPIISGEDA